MKAPDFAYERPTNLDAALVRMTELGGRAKPLAGGQSLIPTLNLRLQSPELLLDIGRLEELTGIAVGDGAIRLGANTRHREILASQLLADACPLLVKAAAHVAHPAIRNRGTIGGSVAFADPAAEFPAVIVALDATVVTRSVRGERRLPARAFYRGLYETALEADELITAIEIPFLKPDERDGFCELARRAGDYAMIGLAGRGAYRQGRFQSLSLAFFPAGDRPFLAEMTAAAIVNGASVEEAKATLVRQLPPFADLNASAATRRRLAGVVLARVLAEITQ